MQGRWQQELFDSLSFKTAQRAVNVFAGIEIISVFTPN